MKTQSFNKPRRSLLWAGALAMATSSVAQAEIIVDTFETAQAPLEVCNAGGACADPTSLASQVSGAGILGTERDLSIEMTGGAPGQGSSIGVIGGGFNTLVWSNDAFADSVAYIQWDGVDGSDALSYGLGDVDVSGLTAITADIIITDLNFFFEIGLYTSATEYTRIAFRSEGDLGTQSFMLDAFTTTADGICSGFGYGVPISASPPLDAGPFVNVVGVECGSAGVVDLTRLNAIQVGLATDPGTSVATSVDLAFTNVRLVPVPSTLALFGSSLLGLGLAARLQRRRKAA